MKCPRFLLPALLLAGSACQSFQEVPLERIERDIGPGDLVRVTDLEEARTRFHVVDVRGDAVLGADLRIPFADIRRIERYGLHPGLVGAGGVVELALAIGVVSAAIAGTNR